MKNFITLKVKMIIWIILSTSIALGCSSSESKKEDNNMKIVATKIFKNATIYTVNEQQEWAQAIAIKDNEIIFVGSDKEVENYIGPQTIITDLKGKMMMPGFHDVHIHPIESGSQNTQFSLDTDELNAEKFIDTIAQASYQNPNSKWLIGYGHSIFALFESSISPLEIINEAVPDRPVIIMEQTSHSMWVNSAALELANIDSNTPNPIGGIIVKDEITGEPNGVLIDNAGNLVMDLAMTPTAQSIQADYDGLVQFTLPELAKNGITSISDARSFWQRDDHLTWQKVEENNELTARVSVGLWAYPELDDNKQLESLISLYSNQEDSFLRFNQIKLYSDGILINTTAAMFDEYEIKLLDTKTNNGINYFTQSRVEKYIKALEPKGFDFHIHAIGERGIYESLNAIENAASSQGRHRITHVEIVDPADYTRFAQLNVTADAQVTGEFTNPEHWHENEELIGVVRSDNAVPIKSLNDAGARITLSSDWSVSPFNPFLGLQNAVTRYPQALTLKQAIEAYTINGAYVMRQEHKVGTIDVGKLADLVILDRNIFNIEPNTINQTKVVMTMLNGEVIYQDQRK